VCEHEPALRPTELRLAEQATAVFDLHLAHQVDPQHRPVSADDPQRDGRLERLLRNQRRERGHARRPAVRRESTLTILSVNFALSLFFLMPILGPQVRGEVVVLAVAVAIWRGARIWWPVVRITESGRGRLFLVCLRNAWRLVVNVEQDEPSVGSKDSPNPKRQDGDRQA
jgi:hypothetical protein